MRLEEIAANPPNLTDTAAVFTSPTLTRQFLETTEKILASLSLATCAQYQSCLALLGGAYVQVNSRSRCSSSSYPVV